MRIFKKSDILDIDALDRELAALSAVSGLYSTIAQLGEAKKADEQHGGAERQAFLDILRTALATGRQRLHQNHLDGASGQYVTQGHAYLMDILLHRLYRFIHHGRDDGRATFSVVATGGYGRGELAPFSDIDLLFLLPNDGVFTRPKPETAPVAAHPTRTATPPPPTTPPDPISQRVEQMLYCLWDMGLDVGHAVRTVQECVQLARQNLEIRTSMLESRFLSGDDALFTIYHDTLFAKVLERGPEAFLRAKLVEQTKRHERFGNSLFYLEPNVKENPGGLRDLQTFSWISKYRYHVDKVRDLIPMKLITEEEYRTFTQCLSFLRRVRNALHYLAGRREDRLTFQHQLDIAKEFGYKDRPGMRGVEQFMRRYYQVTRQASNLSWIFLHKYQEEYRPVYWWRRRALEDCFQLHGDKVVVTDPDAFRQDPVRLMKLFEVSQRHLKSIHPDTLRLVVRDLGLIDHAFRNNPVVSALFIQMLNGKHAVAWVLRRMSLSGVLGRFLPEFGRIIGQSQHDLFHVYTVDEHTIRAVEALRHIKSEQFSAELPVCTALMAQLDYYERGSVILYLSVLLHDIAKGRGGDHQLQGAVIAQQVCLRLGLTESETGMVSWLVGRHLDFSRTAFHRDISDPNTIQSFARQIGTQRRLELLLLLTVADIRAVGPNAWSLWKAELLRRLYHLALSALNRGAFQPDEIKVQAEAQKQAVLALMTDQPVPPPTTAEGRQADIRTYLDRFDESYFLHYEANTIARHAEALLGRGERALAIMFLASPVSDTTELLIYTPDQTGLMSRISGALAMEGVNILSADIVTTKDGMALDFFVVQNTVGKALDNRLQIQRLEQRLTQFLQDPVRPQPVLTPNDADLRRQRTFHVPLSIEVDDSADAFTILEITSLDRVGLLFTITREMELHGIEIRTAKIATYGERAVDVFYVRDPYGLKLTQQKIDSFSKSLHQDLEPEDYPAQKKNSI
ncbi:MAG: [protein-PII] uridylyltransferase [Magnetococcales bacterium]|nr:[protein-PII] uridylyltransferase [Magnetococcales bacterium]